MDEWIRTDITSLRPLGNGGGGDVYLCELAGLDGFRQEAVIKLARPGDRLSEQGLKDEARLLARLRHPNIIQVRDYGRRVVDGHRTPFLLMDHGGVTLDQLCQSMGGRIEPWLATFVALEVCAGLEHAHSRDILHRDIKPANVLIGYQGEVKLIDFGIAWAPNRLQETTQNAWVKGTHCYVPPERLRGEQADARSDLWSLGVMLYEIVDGRRPWVVADEGLPEAQRHRELLELVLETPPPELAPELIPEPLADIIYDLLEKERVARFTSATEVIGR